MGNSTFRDWIPEGEDTGAQGEIFKDFVPPVVPKKKEELKTTVKEEIYKCNQCDFTTKFKVALAGHSRKHK